jgi:signal transduction histidine kinase
MAQGKNPFARSLMDTMEADRKRIASELHDSLGQELLIIKNQALLALDDLKLKANVRERLEEISQTASHAIEEIREIAYDLRPYQIDRLGLTKALESLVKRVAKTAPMTLTADIDPIDHVVPEDVEIHVYRIIQECINNIVKHSNATQARIALKRWHERINIDVEDNGTGFTSSPRGSAGERGLGLQGIAERTRLIGGAMRIESNPGNGTRILITIRIHENANAA